MNWEDILKKLSSFSIGPIAGALVNLITTPVITYFISPEEYGKASMFTLALSIVQLVVFLGMDQAYAKRYYESDDKSSLFINAITPSFVLVILFEIGALFARKIISTWLFGSSDEIICVICLMAIVPALAVESFLMVSIRMSQRGKLYSSMTISLKVLILVATVGALIIYEKSFRAVIVGMTLAQTAFAIIIWFIQGKKLHLDYKEIDTQEIQRLLRFGLPLVPTTIIGWVLTGMDKVMLRSLCTYEDLGFYGVAAKIAAVLTILQACFTTFWVPLAYQWHSENKPSSYYTRVGKTVTAAMSITFLMVILFREVIFLLFPDTYSEAKYIVPFLLFTPIMYTISEVTVMGIYFNEKTGWTAVVSLFSAIVNLTLNSIMIPRLGVIGAAIATGLSYITFFWVRTLLSRRIWYKFPLMTYVAVTVVLLINAIVSSFWNGCAVTLVNVISILFLMLLFQGEVRRVFSAFIQIVRTRTNDG